MTTTEASGGIPQNSSPRCRTQAAWGVWEQWNERRATRQLRSRCQTWSDIGLVVDLTARQVRRLRLRAQLLHPDGTLLPTDPTQVVKHLCAVQAQVPTAVPLAIRARTAGLTASDVERARVEDRSVIRTWCMRGTLQLITAEDFDWLMPLLGPVVVAASRRRLVQVGLHHDVERRAQRIVIRLLSERGPSTRGEIAGRLADRDVVLEDQGVYHLLRKAGLEGVACFGPDRAGEPTYVLVRDWLPHSRPVARAETQSEIVSRYLQAYGPATPADLAAWSGLPIGKTREAWSSLASRLTEVRVQRKQAWMFSTADDASSSGPLRLVPEFDAYLVGYATREFSVAPEAAKLIHAGGGVIRPAVLVDGVAIGAWRRTPSQSGVRVELDLLEPLSQRVRRELAAELKDLSRFLETEITCTMRVASTR